VNFTVTSGGGSVTTTTATTDASGVASTRWRLGAPANLNTLAASAAGTSGGPVVFRGAGCSGGGAGFQITVCIASAMTTSQRGVFQTSAARWSSIIKGDLPDVGGAVPADACGPSPSANQVYDDLLIFAGIVDIDGPGQVLGQAAPCFVRNTGKLPVIGMMRFDAADIAALENNGQFGNVILHEMGHVLGIGTLWELLGLLQNKSTTAAPMDTYFTGAGAIAAFDAIGGTAYTGGQKVPVENTGGAGTMNGHWRESVLKNELMTGFLNAGSNPLSVLTARSLGDMGYTVDPAAADPFFLTMSIREGAEPAALRMHDDIYRIPLYTITPQGVRTRIR
jgi:hypothetical protein